MKRRHIAAWFGAALAGSPAATAQTERQRRIGVLSILPRGAEGPTPFEDALARHGWVEGRNLIIERRHADGATARLPALAAELVASQPEVIFTMAGTPGARAARAATDRIPIVFEAVNDPVASGLVASLGKPGGLLTGSATYTRALDPKRMQLLTETLARPARIAVLDAVRTAEQRARSVDPFPALPGVTHELFEIRGAAELEGAFERITRWKATGLVVMHTPMTSAIPVEITRLALQHRLPGIADGFRFGESGMLMTYTTDFIEAFERGAEYVSRILGGARPADLPVVQVSRFHFVVNQRTARELGVRIPRSILVQATRVIE
ncbi:MAG: ABC transporter substrate-binding protein [Rubrivivax sp.]|nr:ABC transporter substrate-binding protein [Rubrivivax sp.]